MNCIRIMIIGITFMLVSGIAHAMKVDQKVSPFDERCIAMLAKSVGVSLMKAYAPTEKKILSTPLETLWEKLDVLQDQVLKDTIPLEDALTQLAIMERKEENPEWCMIIKNKACEIEKLSDPLEMLWKKLDVLKDRVLKHIMPLEDALKQLAIMEKKEELPEWRIIIKNKALEIKKLSEEQKKSSVQTRMSSSTDCMEKDESFQKTLIINQVIKNYENHLIPAEEVKILIRELYGKKGLGEWAADMKRDIDIICHIEECRKCDAMIPSTINELYAVVLKNPMYHEYSEKIKSIKDRIDSTGIKYISPAEVTELRSWYEKESNCYWQPALLRVIKLLEDALERPSYFASALRFAK